MRQGLRMRMRISGGQAGRNMDTAPCSRLQDQGPGQWWTLLQCMRGIPCYVRLTGRTLRTRALSACEGARVSHREAGKRMPRPSPRSPASCVQVHFSKLDLHAVHAVPFSAARMRFS